MLAELHKIRSFFSHQISALRGGHGVHSPFVYALCENVFYNTHSHYDFSKFEKVRAELMKSGKVIEAGGFGAGSRKFKSNFRSVPALLKHGTSSKKQSEILYRLANFLKIQTCIELGTSLGLNTLFLAAQNPQGKVITIEGNIHLCTFAQELAQRAHASNITFLNATFDEALPSVIMNTKESCLVYLDGDHSYDATMRYWTMLAPLAKPGNVFVFDDIYWSSEMIRAWKKIVDDPLLKVSIDAYHTGYVFFREESREKQHFRLKF